MAAQVYEGRREKLTAKERRQVNLNAAHLLNKLRALADEFGEPISGREEEAFWKFINSLPVDDQSSVIN
jgi:hypothetical protein